MLVLNKKFHQPFLLENAVIINQMEQINFNNCKTTEHVFELFYVNNPMCSLSFDTFLKLKDPSRHTEIVCKFPENICYKDINMVLHMRTFRSNFEPEAGIGAVFVPKYQGNPHPRKYVKQFNMAFYHRATEQLPVDRAINYFKTIFHHIIKICKYYKNDLNLSKWYKTKEQKEIK